MRIGYASGYWGDDPTAPQRLARGADLDYVAMDYLAEITMAILKRQQASDETLGYARDIASLAGDIADTLLDEDITLVTNAGGVNPEACKQAILDETGDRNLTVASVTGDDVLDRITDLREQGVSLMNIDTGDPFEDIGGSLVAANAYLGSFPIAEALESDPDVVVTGRCVDAALVLGPAIHEFGWETDAYDKLAAGTIAGHLLECGTQVTGGVFSEDWEHIDFENMGYPIAEMDSNGEFTVTKPAGTGGRVSEATVKEQLVYEIKDPTAYETPDVTADFTSPTLNATGSERVRVTGVTGSAPPDTLKVAALYEDGYKAQLLLIYSWPDALKKAERAAEILRTRLDDLPLNEIHTSFLGYDGCHPGIAERPDDPSEIVLRVAVKADEEATVREFGRRALPVLISGPPTVTPVVEGRPRASDVLTFWPCTIPRESVTPEVTVHTSGPHDLDIDTEASERDDKTNVGGDH